MGAYDKARLLLIAPAPPPDLGGITAWTRIVMQALRNRADVTLRLVDSMQRWRAPLDLSPRARGVWGSLKALDDIGKTLYWLVRFQPSVLHLCSSGGLATLKDIIILALCKVSGTPSIVHYRMGRIPALAQARGLPWRLMRKAMSLADTVIVLDAASRHIVHLFYPGKHVLQLPNMVQVDRIDTILRQTNKPEQCPQRETEILYVGHVIKSKGIRELVEACKGLDGIPFILRIVGPVEPSFREELLALSGGSPQGAHWLRFEEEVDHERAIRYIGGCDIFVLPSYSEGAPNVLLEAMACSRPILATTVGAVPEMLDWKGSEECGICVEPGNVVALREAIARLAIDEALRRCISQKARSRVERLFAAQMCIERLVSLWCNRSKQTRPALSSSLDRGQQDSHVQPLREEVDDRDVLRHFNR